MMTQPTALATAKDLLAELAKQQSEIERVDRWYRVDMQHRNDRPFLPANSTREYRDLITRAFTPWARLVVSSLAQGMYVDGYRSETDQDEAPVWRCWQANRMDGRQIGAHRGTFAHGLAYADVLPGTYRNPVTGQAEPMPVIGLRSARKMVAVFADPANDDWPMHALRTELSGDYLMIWLYDEEVVHTMSRPKDGGPVTYIDHTPHDSGVCPVIRFTNQLDLDGRITGEIAPVIPLFARIDQDTFDRLIVQRFGAWKVRWGTGMIEPETDEQKRAAQIGLRQTDLLMSESPDTKFGTLDATDINGYIAARDSDIRDLAAATQTPPHHLLGLAPNLSADALAAADASLSRKIEERQSTIGESWEQVLELASQQMGAEPDVEAQVRWRDVDSRSLAQTADALGKLATMLNVPVQMLWEKIPGFTDQDVKRAERLLTENSELTNLIAQIQGQHTPVTSDPVPGGPPPAV